MDADKFVNHVNPPLTSSSLNLRSRQDPSKQVHPPAVKAEIIGINRLMIDEYVYWRHQTRRKKTNWHCSRYYNKKDSVRCSARATTLNSSEIGERVRIFRGPNESPHNHPPDPSDIEEARTNLGKFSKNAVLRGTLSMKTGRSLETQTILFMKNERRYQTFLSKFVKNPVFDRKSIYQAVIDIPCLKIPKATAIDIILDNQTQVMADLDAFRKKLASTSTPSSSPAESTKVYAKKAKKDKLASTRTLRSSTISTSNPSCPRVMSADATEPDEASRVYGTSTETSTSQIITPSLNPKNGETIGAFCHTAISRSFTPSSLEPSIPVVAADAISQTDVGTSTSLPPTVMSTVASTKKHEDVTRAPRSSAIFTSTSSRPIESLTTKSTDTSRPHIVLQKTTSNLTSVNEKTIEAISHTAFPNSVTPPNLEFLSPVVTAETIPMTDAEDDDSDELTDTVNKIIEKLGNETTSELQAPDGPASPSPSPAPGSAIDQNVQSEIASDLDMSSNGMVTSSTQSPLIANPTQAIDEVSQPKTTPAKQSLDTIASVPCTEAAESGKNTEATRQTSSKNGMGIGNKKVLEILASTLETVQRLANLVAEEKKKKKKKKKEKREKEKKRGQRDRNSETVQPVSVSVPSNASQLAPHDPNPTKSAKEEFPVIDLTDEDDVKMNIFGSQPNPSSEPTSLQNCSLHRASMMNIPTHPILDNRNPTLHGFNTTEYVPIHPRIHQYPTSPLAQNIIYRPVMMPFIHPGVQPHEQYLDNAQGSLQDTREANNNLVVNAGAASHSTDPKHVEANP